MIAKKHSPKGKSVRVTFSIRGDSVQNSAAVAGDFNDWSEKKNLLRYDKKNDVWSCSLSLKSGGSYRFRYFVDGEWRNDGHADAYEAGPYASDNCVIHL